MQNPSLKNLQLSQAIQAMSELPFIAAQDEEKYKIHALNFEVFDIQTDGLQPLKSIYMSEPDEKGVHIHSSEENHHVFIFESRAFYKDLKFDDTIYNRVVELMTEEYESTRDDLGKILGIPSYQNDEYWKFAIENRHIESNYTKRRDVPLEFQMIHHSGEFKLTYWLQKKQIIYLTLGHEDKEESVMLIMGMRLNGLQE